MEVLNVFVHCSICILRLWRGRMVTSLAGMPTLAKHSPVPSTPFMVMPMMLLWGFQGLHCMPLGWHCKTGHSIVWVLEFYI
jgi:hypothetical protein